ncbi:hypothetical protein [Chryseobacterium luquanense]|uniref:Uncharacterized protein n=1 Tax=Chryseobacterium luquanense TaxID=2983766 RepID=A0ABT3Y8Z0_9FLAO|nr:hypothetical protein [Chryseobacterium luquanense]MCX8534620.1 hypothetical protein [Chryseobacterium luquanense]
MKKNNRKTIIEIPYIIVIRRFSFLDSKKYKNGLFPEITKKNK